MITFATPPSDETIRLAQKISRENPGTINPSHGSTCVYNSDDGTHCFIGTMLIEAGMTPGELAPFEGAGPETILAAYGVLPLEDGVWLSHLQTLADERYFWDDIIIHDNGAIESPIEGEDEYVE